MAARRPPPPPLSAAAAKSYGLLFLLVVATTLVKPARGVEVVRGGKHLGSSSDVHHRAQALKSTDDREGLIASWGDQEELVMRRSSRRMLIGSLAPTCTYNECRGCRYRCRAEQIPVDASDPVNSAYHYRCMCHW